MKFFLALIFSFMMLYANELVHHGETTLVLTGNDDHGTIDSNETAIANANAPVVVEDTSGMSNDEVRKQASKDDVKVKKKEELNTAIDAMLDGTFNTLETKEKTWNDLSPSPKNYDWIQTKSGEWFKGYIKAMFDKKLEFDSSEINMHTFKFKNITQIKSYQIVGVNIEGVAIFEGVIRMKDGKITIIQGNNRFEFPKSEVISFAHSGASEKDKWYAKVSISVDWREGNTNQTDYSAQATFKRRTAKTRLVFDYLGRYTSVSKVSTVNDHRLNEKYDIYLTKNFYWTPLFSEYRQDIFKNINAQVTAGAGVGYMLINTDDREWDITAGPAVLFTNYISVAVDEKSRIASYSAEFSTKFEDEWTKDIDFTFSYKFTLTDHSSGLFKHHMLVKLENELTKWLDLDFTYVWDFTAEPAESLTGLVPKRDDFQFLIGLGIEY